MLIWPMECMAEMAVGIKISKSMNGPARVKWLPSNGKMLGYWHVYSKLMHHKLGLYIVFRKNILSIKVITYRKGIIWINLRIGIGLRVLVSRRR
jgi:hypothetical protein